MRSSALYFNTSNVKVPLAVGDTTLAIRQYFNTSNVKVPRALVNTFYTVLPYFNTSNVKVPPLHLLCPILQFVFQYIKCEGSA